jgi:MFS family permease
MHRRPERGPRVAVAERAKPAGRRRKRPRSRDLTSDERAHLLLIGLPTFGLALAITVVSTYLPTVAERFTGSTTIIGVLIGGEGVGAILLPIAVGAWSDRLRTRWGGRLPLVLAGTPIAVLALLAMGFVGSLGALAIAIGVFFVGYFVAYEPYRAFYPDVVPDEVAAKGQSTQAVWRATGTGLALLGGGVLLDQGQAAPFMAAAAILTLSIGLFAWLTIRRGVPKHPHSSAGSLETVREMAHVLVDDPVLRAFFFANALWEFAIAALKTFVVLWMTVGLGMSLTSSALIIGAAALPILGGAVASGMLADRFGRRRVMGWGVIAFGAPMLVPLLSTWTPLLLVAVPFIAFGGGMLMSLPYALLQPLMPKDRHGALTGFYSASRGLGVMLGPLLGGFAISLLRGPLSATHGYSAVWAVCGIGALASLPLLRRIG